MKIKIAVFFAAWITIASTFANAQTILSLSGKVIGADNKPLDGAAVYLLKGQDSVLVKTALADASGLYSFRVKPGAYRLSVSMMGYQAYKSGLLQLEQDKVLEPVILQASGRALKEVNVIAQRPFVQQKIDRTIISPEALISNAGSTALEVLEKAPGKGQLGNWSWMYNFDVKKDSTQAVQHPQ